MSGPAARRMHAAALLLAFAAAALPSSASAACTAFGTLRNISFSFDGSAATLAPGTRDYALESPPTGCEDAKLTVSDPREVPACNVISLPYAIKVDSDGLYFTPAPTCSNGYESNAHRIPNTVTFTYSGSAGLRIKSVFIVYSRFQFAPYYFRFSGPGGRVVETAGITVEDEFTADLQSDFVLYNGQSATVYLFGNTSGQPVNTPANYIIEINKLAVELVPLAAPPPPKRSPPPPPVKAPGAPTIASVAQSGTDLSFTLNKPSSTGGAPVTQYKVVATPPTGAAVEFTAAPAAVAGKPNQVTVRNALNKYVQGTRYTFKAYAINTKGAGAASAGLAWRVPFQAGAYTFKLVGRASCAAKGFATALACSTSKTEVTLTTAGGALAKFELKPAAGTNAVGNPLLINASGRGTCAKVVQPDSNTCSNTKVVAKAGTTQRWVVEESGTTGQYFIRSVGRNACATKFLGASNTCGDTTLLMVGASGASNLWTLAKA